MRCVPAIVVMILISSSIFVVMGSEETNAMNVAVISDISYQPSDYDNNSPDNTNIIGSDESSVTVKFIISGAEEKALRHAEISLYQNDEKKYSGKTDDAGNCEITEVQKGTYKVKVTCNGYVTYQNNITIDTDGQIIPITMEKKEITTYGGMTMYHLLMFMGIFIGVILVIIAYILCTRNWREVDRSDLEE